MKFIFDQNIADTHTFLKKPTEKDLWSECSKCGIKIYLQNVKFKIYGFEYLNPLSCNEEIMDNIL